MEQLLKDFVQGDPWVTAFGIGFALFLVLILRLLIPREERNLLRQPLLFVLLYAGGALLLRFLPPQASEMRRPLAIAALIMLLAAIGRASVLLVLDVILGRRMVRPLPRIIKDITQGIVYVIVLFLALRAAGVEPGSILTTSALLTAVIGLSLQETLGNVFAGLSIQIQRPFDVGDWIQFESGERHIGRVVEINWRATRVVTLDDVEVTVPNGAIAKAAITNYTKPDKISRRSVYVSAAYDAPPHKVQDVILAAIEGSPGVVKEPAPSVVTFKFGDAGIEYWVRFFTDQFHKRDGVDGAVRDRIWYAFHRAGISIPFPQRVVHMEDVSVERKEREIAERVAKRDRALRRVDFLDFVPPDLHMRLAAMTHARLYSPGETVVRQGDETNEMYIIETGEVAVSHEREGQPVEIARLGPGKFFGEIALVTGDKRNATVRAVTQCELLVVDHEAFNEILHQSPGLAEHISRVLAERQAELEGQVAASTDMRGAAVEERSNQLLERIKKFFVL